MKNKFSKKLLALFLAIVMVLTAFTGAFSAFAADESYYDGNISDSQVNDLGWVELTDEQTADALLDYLDDLLASANIAPIDYQLSLPGIIDINIDNAVLDSVNGLLDLAQQGQANLEANSGVMGSLGDLKNVSLEDFKNLEWESVSTDEVGCGKDFRAKNSSIEILTTIFSAIERLTANWNGSKAVLKQVLTGQLSLGLLEVAVDPYPMINEQALALLFGEQLPEGYENNLVHHIVAKLITEFTDWFTEEEAEHIYNGDAGYELDTVLFRALSTQLLQQINVEVTYPDGTSSRDHYGTSDQDPNLCYTPDGNVYIFQYNEDASEDGSDDVNLMLTPDETLFEFSYEALEVAWKTVLSTTLSQLNNADYGSVPHDYNYSEWFESKGYTWDYLNVANNYSSTYVEQWASETGLDLETVKADLTFNRELVDDPSYNWRDIKSQYLFNKVCRSPLMVYYFHEETGPLNTNIKCTGTPNIDAFFEQDYSNYTSILGGFNDFLVAAVKDFLPDYAGELATTGNTTNASTIATTLVPNALKVVQYVADATDKNILSSFYNKYGSSAVLSEAKFEEAMVPFLIACLENNLDGLLGQIHKDKWDACKDAEGVAVVALEEYLSYILPHLDYSEMITKDENGYYDVDLNTILAMCRDAVGYVMTQYVPVSDANGNPWSIYDVTAAQTYNEQVSSGTDILSLLNSVIVYYANEKGAGSLLGCINPDTAECLITRSNTIWENIDIAVNQLLPVLGELQFGSNDKYGKFDSEDLIWNDIVSGVLNIGDTAGHEETGGGGITNFIYRLATIIGSPSISSKGVDLVVYDLVKDLFNGILNPRYSDSYYADKDAEVDVIPDVSGTAAAANPFHNLIQRDVFAGTVGDDTDIGVFGKFVVNVAEASGYKDYPDTLWEGAMFVVNAVASFVPAFLPSIQEYEVGDLGVSQSAGASSSYNYSTFNFDITLENLGHGINRYIKDDTGAFKQQSRSYIQIDSIEANKGSFSLTGYDSYLEPSESTTVNVSGSVPQSAFGGENSTVVSFIISYRILDENGNPYALDTDSSATYNKTFTKTVNYSLTTVSDWYNLTYNSASTGNPFTETNFEAGNSPATGTYSSLTTRVVEVNNFLWRDYGNVQYPNEIVVRTSQLDDINYPLYLINETSDKGIDGVAAVKTFSGTDHFAVTCDPETGDLVNVFYYDYYKDGQWVTDQDLNRQAVLDLMANDFTITDYRFHVVCPYEQIDSFTFVDGYKPGSHEVEYDEEGNFSIIWLPIDSGNYKTVLDYSKTQPGDVSLSSCVPGIVLAFNKITTSGGNEVMDFLVWDQETQVSPGTTSDRDDIGYRIISSYPQTFTMPITVADDSGESESAQAVYSESAAFINNYTTTDVEDASVYSYFYDAAMGALAAQELPITTDNALAYGSVKANNTVYTSTTNPIGDVAYKLATESDLAGEAYAGLRGDLYENGGVYYVTRYSDGSGYVYANPVFKHEKATPGNGLTLTDETVSINLTGKAQNYQVYTLDGTDLKAVYVREPGEDAVAEYHLLNDIQYVKEWQDLGSGSGELFEDPYYMDTDEQATTDSGSKLYDEISFTYRDAANRQTSSTNDEWTLKFAETNYGVVDDPDLRGLIARAVDKAEYALQLVNDHLKVSYAKTLFDRVNLVRSDLNNANFEVISYENMAAAGRAAESLISVDYYRSYYLVDESGEKQLAFECLDSASEAQLETYNEIHSTEYELSDFASEVDNTKNVYSSNATSFEVNEAIRMFELYLAGVEERGYIGDKLEEEISCAVNGKSCENKDYKQTSYKSVSVDVENVSYAVDGATYTASSNPDGVTYTADSWAEFISALDAAVDAAVNAESYTYKDAGIYKPADKDKYIYQVSDVYELRTNLMRAENGLTVAEAEEPEGYTVSAFVGVLTAPGEQYGQFAVKDATVSIQTDAGEISAVTGDDGKFTLENVPDGTYTATITYKYGFDRTFKITVDGANVESTTMIGIIACNWDGGSDITGGDASNCQVLVGVGDSSDLYDRGYDLDLSGDITGGDYSICTSFIGVTSSYDYGSETIIQN